MFGNRILEIKRSKYNGEIVVKNTLGLGTYLQVDGITQSGKIIESIWKPILKKINAKNVLILGLGGGTVAKLLRKYFPNSKISGIEIDPAMISLGKKYLNLGKYKVDIKIKDANKFETDKKFDLILVDLYQGKNFPQNFETKKFMEKLRSFLAKNGKIAINRLGKENHEFEKTLKDSFSTVEVINPLINTVYICFGKRN